jgi:uncharacterized membrane protein YkvA (DUF1232 family)
VKDELDGLICMVERAMESGNTRSSSVRKAVAALAYLRNPYDHIFDLHSEGGFVDDIDVIRKAWAAVSSRGDSKKHQVTRQPSGGLTHAVDSATLLVERE